MPGQNKNVLFAEGQISTEQYDRTAVEQLYVLLHIFSRHVVGWMVAHRQ